VFVKNTPEEKSIDIGRILPEQEYFALRLAYLEEEL
jgi:hypothetical protein